MTIQDEQYQCKKCGEYKSHSDFPKDRSRPSGYHPYCKLCRNKEYIRRTSSIYRPRPPRSEIPPGMKFCPACKQVLRHEEFAISRHESDGKFWRCRKCQSALSKIYLQNNPDVMANCLASTRRWAEKHSERVKAASRRHYARHKDEVNRRAMAWTKAHPEARSAAGQRYRARLINAEGSFTRQEWKALCDWFGNRCLRCGASERLSIDHVVPLSLGGTNYIDNLQPLCRSCNSSKQGTTADHRDPDQLAKFLVWLRQSE